MKQGNYFVEVGRRTKTPSIGRSVEFLIKRPLGNEDMLQDGCVEIGVWCKCGVTNYKKNDPYKGLWIECTNCKSWHHSSCYSKRRQIINPKDKEWLCYFCTEERNEDSSSKTKTQYVTKFLSMLPSDYGRKHSNLLCTTPANIGKFIRRVLGNDVSGYKTIELGGGNGAISKFLPKKSLVIEIVNERYREGKNNAAQCRWKNEDYLSRQFLTRMLSRKFKFKVIVANPDYEVAFHTIFVGLNLLDQNDDARLLFLLPSNYFEASVIRARLYGLLNFSH